MHRMRTFIPALALLLAAVVPSGAAYASDWQVAGVVNMGEPSLRVVYDASYPGSRPRAMYIVNTFRQAFWQQPQPGVIDGLMEVGYSEHIEGVQVQVYSNSPYMADYLMGAFDYYGLSMTGCYQTPEVCPTWGGA